MIFKYLDSILIAFLLIHTAIKSIRAWHHFKLSLKENNHNSEANDISVVVPIFGFDLDVQENIPHLIELAKSNHKVEWRFCLSWRDHSAREFIIEKIGALKNCKILVSQKKLNVSDKNLNMLTGLENIVSSKVIFIDIDNQIPVDFVNNFNEALNRFAAVTSFSYYSHNIQRFIWWSSDISDFLRQRPLYLWGGAMGFSFNLIKKNEIINVLNSNIHDDLPLTKLLYKHDLEFYFDTNSFGKSNGNNHPESFHKWTLRLSVFGKYGLTYIWYRWLIGHILHILILSFLLYSNLLYFFIDIMLFSFYYYLKSILTFLIYAKKSRSTLDFNMFILLLYCCVMVFYEPIINIIALFKKDLTYRKIKYTDLK